MQGSRGPLLDKIFELQDKLELEAIQRGPRQDFAQLLVKWAGGEIGNPLVSQQGKDQLLAAYFYNWVEDIDAAVENWAEVGLAFAKAMWDAQSKRDLQNLRATEDAPGQQDAPTDLNLDPDDPLQGNNLRRQVEAGVGVLDVFLHELDDPNNDGSSADGYINKYLLPAIGLPDFTGDLRVFLEGVADDIDALVKPITDQIDAFVMPIKEALGDYETAVKDYLGEQFEQRFGVGPEAFQFLFELGSKMDLATLGLEIGPISKFLPIFKPGDHERLDMLLGFDPNVDHHEDLPGYVVTVGFDGSDANVVDVIADTIALGAGHGLKTGDRVVYRHGDVGTDIGGLEDGTAYFVRMTGDAAQLYDTQAQAVAGGPTGLRNLQSVGTGAAHALDVGEGLFGFPFHPGAARYFAGHGLKPK